MTDQESRDDSQVPKVSTIWERLYANADFHQMFDNEQLLVIAKFLREVELKHANKVNQINVGWSQGLDDIQSSYENEMLTMEENLAEQHKIISTQRDTIRLLFDYTHLLEMRWETR